MQRCMFNHNHDHQENRKTDPCKDMGKTDASKDMTLLWDARSKSLWAERCFLGTGRQEHMHANNQYNQHEHGVLLAAHWDTFAAPPVSPRTLGIM